MKPSLHRQTTKPRGERQADPTPQYTLWRPALKAGFKTQNSDNAAADDSEVKKPAHAGGMQSSDTGLQE